jgi:hypothetical protein
VCNVKSGPALGRTNREPLTSGTAQKMIAATADLGGRTKRWWLLLQQRPDFCNKISQ